MLNTNINIYHHPTTVLFLDDDSDFFASIHFRIAKSIRCKFFDDPEAALEMSHLPFADLPRVTPQEVYSHVPVHDALFENHKPLDRNRFFEPSVLVVDYDMPGSNGLDVCAKVTNPYIKKILLTGVADEKLAVEALNEGLIDYFIRKQENDIAVRIVSVIQKLQKKYFSDILIHYPIYYEPPHIKDSGFSDYFVNLIEQYGIVEYYYMDQPMGFLLINKQGQAMILLAYTDEEVDAHIVDCQNQDAPKHLIDKLTTHQYVPYFYCTEHHFYDPSITDWMNYLHPVTRVVGRQNYYTSLLKDIPKNKLLRGYRDIILASYAER